MIDLYYCPTPNCQKISIALEELDLPYQVHAVDIVAGDQNDPEYAALCPNRKVPAIVDRDGPGAVPLVLWESGAILLYLARKTERLLPTDTGQRALCEQWLFWQASYLGPMMGQLHHFVQYAPERLPYPIARYESEVERLRRLLDAHLEGREFLVDEYSVADISCAPWLKMFGFAYPHPEPYPHLDGWLDRIFERSAVQRGIAVDLDKIRPVVVGAEPVTDEVRRHLFASYQAETQDGPTKPGGS
ncbi:MAG: glutathione S-transferase N-terminal domain-containing protein [Candidatus Binatia bacterium]|nr:glutathione S-transferase N-terminal domain-containing protein [Candidatus Binatia bacterium]